MFKKPDKVIVCQGQYKSFDIDSKGPYKIFQAYPLISCFAFLFSYNNSKSEQKAILYHAPIGILEELPLKQIINLIEKDSKLSDVNIVITPSGEETEKALNQAKSELKSCGFTKTPTVNNSSSIYCADTSGQHGVVISQRSIAGERQSSSLPKPTFDSDDDLP